MKDTSIIFVLDPPKLVTDGILLLASIRRHMPGISVLGYCPADKAELIPLQVREFFKAHRAEIRYFDNTNKFDPPYPHGNKILACAEPRETAFSIFLDTDIVLWQGFDPELILRPETISASPEGVMTWGRAEGSWQRVYGMFDLETPEDTVQLTRSGRDSKPYFNAGVIGFPNGPAAGFASFGALWLDTAQRIEANDEVESRRPWLDQIALPVAIARAGWAYNPLEKRWNLSLSRKAISDDLPEKKAQRIGRSIGNMDAIDAVFLHYHAPKFLYGTRYEGYFEDLARQFTCFATLDDLSPNNVRNHEAQKSCTKRMNAITAIPKQERTDEQRSQFGEFKRQRRSLRQAARNPSFDAWPASILPAGK